jgi:hypothetical protein
MAKITRARAIRNLNAAILELKKFNIDAWGFLFTDHGADETNLELFSGRREPLPVFIVKTEEALKVIRTMPVDGIPVSELEQDFAEAHAAAMQGSRKIIKPN